jgi:hypothetical protein
MNISSPAHPTILPSNKMIVSPQGQLVLVGEKDAELLGVSPVTNAAPVVLSSNKMTVSPQG